MKKGGRNMKPFVLFSILSLLLSAPLCADHGVPGCGVAEVDRDTAEWVNALLNSQSSRLAPPAPRRGPSRKGPAETAPAPAPGGRLDLPSGGGGTAQETEGSSLQEIEVAFHVVTGGEEGKMGEEVVTVLLDNLNWAYRETPFRFRLRSVDFTDNKAWFEQCAG